MMKGVYPDQPHVHLLQPRTPRWVRYSLILNVAALAALLWQGIGPPLGSLIRSSSPSPPSTWPQPVYSECHALLPSFLETKPPSGAEPSLQKAFRQLDSVLQREFRTGGIDSLSVAVVASKGSLYEGFWGRRRANESDGSTVDRHSIYRLASVSKLFTALETLILRDRGVLRLDDPISSVCPEFRYPAPVTFRALMSHMSGIGADLPPGNARGHWPDSVFGAGPPPYNGLDFPSRQQVFDAVANNRPVVAPYTYPVYSNTGYSLLGIANVAANRIERGPNAPATHADLVQQDIFDPLGFNGTTFLVTEAHRPYVVVPSINPWEIDQDFKDALNPAGGQMSSLSDIVKVMQTLLNPQRPESLLSPYTVREWLRPLHVWFDDYSKVGALWEIYASRDAYGRTQPLYQKLGELPGYHTAFTLVPVHAYGIVVLQSGPTSETLRLTNLVTSHVQPAFDRLLEDVTRDSLVGKWRSADGRASLAVEIDRGSLYVREYLINGTDVVRVVQGGQPDVLLRLPLWTTDADEYRMAVPTTHAGCLFSWVTLDNYGYVDGVSTNVIVSSTDRHGGRVLYLPGINTELRR